MKYSLKNEYKELLEEEVVNIERFNPSRDEIWDIEIDPNTNKIIKSDKKDLEQFNIKTYNPSDINVIMNIVQKYSTVSPGELANFFVEAQKKDANFQLRISTANMEIDNLVNYLNMNFKPMCLGLNKSISRIGIGELACHLAFNTTNWNTVDEPDVILDNGKKISVKNFRSGEESKTKISGYGRGTVRTGESKTESAEIREAINAIHSHIGKTTGENIPTNSDSIKEYCENVIQTLDSKTGIKQLKELLALINDLKKKIVSEHKTDYILAWNGLEFQSIDAKNPSSIDKFGIREFKDGRATYQLMTSISFDTAKISKDEFYNQDEFYNELINLNNIFQYIKDEHPKIADSVKNLLNYSLSIAADHYTSNAEFYNFANQDSIKKNIINDSQSITSQTNFKKIIKLAKENLFKSKDKVKFQNPRSSSEQKLFELILNHYIKNYSYYYIKLRQLSLPPGSRYKNIELESLKYNNKKLLLKEVYSHLFKKKLVSEGGLAGHMMHPYEALDMTPRQIIDRIKEYGVPQSIIEKVDGQNLFFTVETDGTLMFARNKEDMTHNDLVEKFTNHPAEVPFVTGGNAIKRGIDQWLSSAGSFGQQEILDIFHPDGEARSFINFEIMHKDHPNQIEYGENYIVFHSIVDFVDGREAVYSSNNSQRLDKLINLMRQGVESGGYILASNRTVDLNSLSNVQIEDYIIRIKEITESLGITEDQFLADGVLNVITEEMKNSGINLSEEAYRLLSDFVLYGEDSQGNKIKSKDFTSLMDSADVKVLRAAGLTSANKALSKVLSILSPFKEVFVDLGIDLLKNVKSAYASSDSDQQNISILREKLNVAIEDLQEYYLNVPESNWTSTARRLVPHLEKILEKGVDNIVSTSVEGGVYDHEGDLLKVTGGFAPMNQILGAAYRDREGIFTTFKQKFMQQESNRRSLKTIFSSIY